MSWKLAGKMNSENCTYFVITNKKVATYVLLAIYMFSFQS